MPFDKPFRRTWRPFASGQSAGPGTGKLNTYILHKDFAVGAEHYVRSFQLLLKDLRELFDYVEPSAANAQCYSFRIHELLIRSCIEVEANCKAILIENGYRDGNLDMRDYSQLNSTHRLSDYKLKIPGWRGDGSERVPFAAWNQGERLPWYAAYNATKHDRYREFETATLTHAVDALCAVLALLSAQFYTVSFDEPIEDLYRYYDPVPPRGWQTTPISGALQVWFPEAWPNEQRYDFSIYELEKLDEPFGRLF